jgi:hypothetical protein
MWKLHNPMGLRGLLTGIALRSVFTFLYNVLWIHLFLACESPVQNEFWADRQDRWRGSGLCHWLPGCHLSLVLRLTSALSQTSLQRIPRNPAISCPIRARLLQILQLINSCCMCALPGHWEWTHFCSFPPLPSIIFVFPCIQQSVLHIFFPWPGQFQVICEYNIYFQLNLHKANCSTNLYAQEPKKLPNALFFCWNLVLQFTFIYLLPI